MKTKQMKFIIGILLGIVLAGCFGLLAVLNIGLALQCLILVVAVLLGYCFKFGKFTVLDEKGRIIGGQRGQGGGALTANAAGEMRTSISAVMGFADLLRHEKDGWEQRKLIGAICSNSKVLLEIIEEISPGECKEADEGKADSVYDAVQNNVQDAGEEIDRQYAVEASLAKVDETESHDKGHILIVDDVQENVLLTELLLQKEGYTTGTCTNGKEAVETTREQKFDLILMDIQMPEMNGLEATRIIKKQALNIGTTIIAMTASLLESDKTLCIEAGCDDYISKPIKRDLLLRKIERYFRQNEQIKDVSKGGEIISLLSDNPDYHKTIEMFVHNLPGRIRQMQECLDKGNLGELSLKIHALKGLGSFAGFAVYTEKARAIEQKIKNNEIDMIRHQLDEMATLCLRTKLPSSQS